MGYPRSDCMSQKMRNLSPLSAGRISKGAAVNVQGSYYYLLSGSQNAVDRLDGMEISEPARRTILGLRTRKQQPRKEL